MGNPAEPPFLTQGSDDVIGSAERMAAALGDPERLEREVFERGAGEVLLDLRTARDLVVQRPGGYEIGVSLYRLVRALEGAGPPGWERARVPGMLMARVRDVALFEEHDEALAARAEERLAARRLPYLRARSGLGRWSAESGTPIVSVVVTADGHCAITTTRDGSVTFWDLPEGLAVHTIPAPEANAPAAPALASLGLAGLFARASSGAPLSLLDLTSGQVVQEIETCELAPDGAPVQQEQVWGVSISRNARFAAAVTDAGSILAWDLSRTPALSLLRRRSTEPPPFWNGPTSREPRGLAITGDGRNVVVGMEDGRVAIHRPVEDEIVHPASRHEGVVTCVAVMPDERRVLSGSKDGSLKLWDLETGALLRSFEADPVEPGPSREAGSFPRAIRDAAVTEDGRFAVVVIAGEGPGLPVPDNESSLEVWDLEAGRMILRLPIEPRAAASMTCAITPDGRLVLVSGAPALGVVEWIRWDEVEAAP